MLQERRVCLLGTVTFYVFFNKDEMSKICKGGLCLSYIKELSEAARLHSVRRLVCRSIGVESAFLCEFRTERKNWFIVFL